jgi:1-acyl-sn-glycerol-3-phosphate acyltransferase
LNFHTGAIRICADYGIPYVPVGINGVCKPFKGEVLINIGEPVYLEDCLDYKLAAANMKDKIRQLI